MKFIAFCSFVLFATCGAKFIHHNVTLDPSEKEIILAFGSCNHHDDPQLLWDDVIKQKPDVWIWLGDIVYADTEDMEVTRKKYQSQKANLGYKNLYEQCKVIGVWDDHDFGVNDGGKDYPMKKESQKELLDFLDVDADDPRRSREGMYSSYTIEKSNKKVKVLLLDARYFRDHWNKKEANTEGTILGETQWQWLESELKNSEADLHVIGSGIQILSADHKYEKWANFPNERKRLIDLLKKYAETPTIFISGDRHTAEFSLLEDDGLDYDLYDITSSGLTHTFIKAPFEQNDLRVGERIREKNFGLIRLNIESRKMIGNLEIRGDENTLHKHLKVIY